MGSRHRTGELENQGSRATSPASPRRGDLTVATCSIMALRRSSKPSMAYGARSRRPAPGAAEASVPRYAPGAESDWELESGWTLQQTPIGNSAMGAGDRRVAEAVLHTPRTRPAPKDNRQSVMSLFLYLPLSPAPNRERLFTVVDLKKPGPGRQDRFPRDIPLLLSLRGGPLQLRRCKIMRTQPLWTMVILGGAGLALAQDEKPTASLPGQPPPRRSLLRRSRRSAWPMTRSSATTTRQTPRPWSPGSPRTRRSSRKTAQGIAVMA